jgi:hypothetical protein
LCNIPSFSDDVVESEIIGYLGSIIVNRPVEVKANLRRTGEIRHTER